MKKALLLSLGLMLALASGAWAQTVVSSPGFINVANSNGVEYNYDYLNPAYASQPGAASGTYYINILGTSGQNEAHISSTNTGSGGAITAPTSSPSGTGSFYVTNTGGRGLDDDIILLASISGPISSSFSLTVSASGYTWTPQGIGGTVNEPLPAQSSLSIAGITNQTFYPSSLIYGPQAVKPAGNGGAALWVGQNTSDPTTDAYLMFIDLYAGDLKSSDPYTGLVNNGALAVNFSFTGLYGDTLALNVYAWNGESQGPGEGLGFTNSTASTGSGYEIVDTAVAPVPVPPSLFLLAGGLGGLGMLRKRWVSR